MKRFLFALLLALSLPAYGATPSSLFPAPKFSAHTSSGTMCVGCKLYTYVAGSSTPLSTYTDSAGGTANANPVILDSRGEANIWFDGSKLYKVILKTAAEATLYTVDNYGITGIGVSYIQAESGATRQGVQDGLRQRGVTVKEFGAVCDGTTDDATAITAAANAARTVIIPKSSGACRISSNVSIAATTALQFEAGGSITVDTTRTLTVAGSILAPRTQILAGAGSFVLTGTAEIPAEWMGCKGDASTNNATCVTKAIATAQGSNNASVTFGAGIFNIGSEITITGANKGIAILGTMTSRAQGSQRRTTTLRYTGGATPMFTVDTSYVRFKHLGIENTGTGTHWIKSTINGGRLDIHDVSVAAGGNGPTQVAFSSAVIGFINGGGLTDNAGPNYSTIDNSEFTYAAPVIVDYNNAQANNGFTWLHFDNNLIDANANMSVIRIINGGAKLLRMTGNTFNAQPAIGAPYVFEALEMTNIGTCWDGVNPKTPNYIDCFLDNLLFRDNEYDDGAQGTTSANKMLKLRNVRYAEIQNNNIAGSSAATSYIDVIASDNLFVAGNRLFSLNGPLVTTQDATSRVIFGPNPVSTGNTQGLINNGTTGAGVVDITAAVLNVIVEPHKGLPNGHTVFRFDAPNNSNYAVTLAVPGDAVPSYPTRGQIITVQVRNTSGGVMGTITFSASYKTAGSFTVPANGNSRSLTCVYTGTACVELYRTAADVAN